MKRATLLLLIIQLFIFVACSRKYGKIVFTSNRDGNEEIYVMNDDGTNQMNLTNNPAFDWYPNWSPDGKKIVFGSYRDASGENDEDIYVMNADGSNVERLTYGPAWSGFAAWSPDGSRIAFCSDRDGAEDIFIMNVDGSNVTRLTNDPEPEYYPCWSPDGSQIVYVRIDSSAEGKIGEPRGPNEGNCEIYVINVDGTNQVNISNNPLTDGYPSWSPDGKRIAFNRAFYEGEEEVCNVCIMDPDGNNFMQLTHQSTIHEPSGGGVPRWSPDGSRIVFQSENEQGHHDIYMVNADGTNRVNLTNNSADDWYAAYSPIWYKY